MRGVPEVRHSESKRLVWRAKQCILGCGGYRTAGGPGSSREPPPPSRSGQWPRPLTSCSCSILMLGLAFTSSRMGFRFFMSRMSNPRIWAGQSRWASPLQRQFLLLLFLVSFFLRNRGHMGHPAPGSLQFFSCPSPALASGGAPGRPKRQQGPSREPGEGMRPQATCPLSCLGVAGGHPEVTPAGPRPALDAPPHLSQVTSLWFQASTQDTRWVVGAPSSRLCGCVSS